MSNLTRNFTVKVKTARKRKQGSTLWLQRQLNDPYVKQAKIDGYRSRAAYKLLEINDKFKIFKKHSKIIDLGAAPGGWTQVVSRHCPHSKIYAFDILTMDEMTGVEFMQIDFRELDAVEKIKNFVGGKVDLLLSDMAPNACGNQQVDHLRIITLCELAFDFAKESLNEGGSMVVKIFRGGGDHQLLAEIKKYFTQVKSFKPKSSRSDSSEMYLVALGFRGAAVLNSSD